MEIIAVLVGVLVVWRLIEVGKQVKRKWGGG